MLVPNAFSKLGCCQTEKGGGGGARGRGTPSRGPGAGGTRPPAPSSHPRGPGAWGRDGRGARWAAGAPGCLVVDGASWRPPGLLVISWSYCLGISGTSLRPGPWHPAGTFGCPGAFRSGIRSRKIRTLVRLNPTPHQV
jgi:hypothetical protein